MCIFLVEREINSCFNVVNFICPYFDLVHLFVHFTVNVKNCQFLIFKEKNFFKSLLCKVIFVWISTMYLVNDKALFDY